ncbi:ABC transporter ATP-binding protein [Fibrobacterota bacterium]
MPEPVITVTNACKTYGAVKAVDVLSFKVPPKTCFGFLGPNGAGKTTMMKMLYGRCSRDMGSGSSLQVLGFDPHTHELNIKYLSGVVPQEDNLDSQLNVFQNLLVYSKFYGMEKKEAGMRIESLLEFLELSDKRLFKIKELSGGIKRRLIIARALLHHPRLLILDEPTTGLDPQVRHLIWEKIRGLKEDGTTVLITTHYMEEAFQLCDTIIIMDKGKNIVQGNPQSLLDQNIEPWVLELKKQHNSRALYDALDPDRVRVDDARDPPLFYSRDLDCLKHMADALEQSEYHLRQSNLEDLFLKATGRTLNERQ